MHETHAKKVDTAIEVDKLCSLIEVLLASAR